MAFSLMIVFSVQKKEMAALSVCVCVCVCVFVMISYKADDGDRISWLMYHLTLLFVRVCCLCSVC